MRFIVKWLVLCFRWRLLSSEKVLPGIEQTKAHHYWDVIMGAMVSQITSLTIVYSTITKKASKLCVTGPCAGNSPVTGEFPAQMTSNAENVSIWWRHHLSLSKARMTKITDTLSTHRGPFYWHGLTLIPAWISNYIHYELRDNILIHSQTSTVQPLKFRNR